MDPPSLPAPPEPPSPSRVVFPGSPRGTLPLVVWRGIPVRIHYSTLIALPFFAWLAEAKMRAPVTLAMLAGEGGPLAPTWAWALLLSLGLVATVLLHEGAHVIAGRICGGRVAEISLLLLGGCTRIDGLPTRRARIGVAAAGPAVSIGAGLLLDLLGLRFPFTHVDLRYAFLLLGQVQLAFGAIDLLPSPPLDGGRLLVALLERRIGRVRATLQAARLGKVMAGLLAMAGALSPSLVLLGLAGILWAGADESSRATARAEALRGVTVRTVLVPAPWIDGHAPLSALAERMRSERALRFVVVEEGILVGVVAAREVARVDPRDREGTPVRELARPAPTVAPDEPVADAGALLRAAGVGLLPVLDRGALVGMVTDEALGAAEEMGGLDPGPEGSGK